MKIQASIAGFGKQAATVYGLYDEESGYLVVNKIAKAYRDDRFENCLVISNQNLKTRDVLFSEEMLQEAITSFFDLQNSGRLRIEDAAQQCNPSNRIEQDEVKESGRSYRMQGIDDSQIAVLAMCHYVKRAQTIDAVLSMQDALLSLSKGSILSI
jgi:hypothetical protein